MALRLRLVAPFWLLRSGYVETCFIEVRAWGCGRYSRRTQGREWRGPPTLVFVGLGPEEEEEEQRGHHHHYVETVPLSLSSLAAVCGPTGSLALPSISTTTSDGWTFVRMRAHGGRDGGKGWVGRGNPKTLLLRLEVMTHSHTHTSAEPIYLLLPRVGRLQLHLATCSGRTPPPPIPPHLLSLHLLTLPPPIPPHLSLHLLSLHTSSPLPTPTNPSLTSVHHLTLTPPFPHLFLHLLTSSLTSIAFLLTFIHLLTLASPLYTPVVALVVVVVVWSVRR
ncbi:hypothetical protein Pmani_006387 [Petrolisthes manimaculis]|uniref:Uncharacterized protein n=1 Tax=Petrolisthes manimaculis TaxID=1843537 RepID=A0AAE1QB06_9EUCA|nr:hypothetical protein Pmani_006387 [Petrolisthes manimaculis]